MDQKTPDKAPKPDKVKIIGMSTQILPGALEGQLTLNIYGLGDDGKIYTFNKDKSWVEF